MRQSKNPRLRAQHAIGVLRCTILDAEYRGVDCPLPRNLLSGADALYRMGLFDDATETARHGVDRPGPCPIIDVYGLDADPMIDEAREETLANLEAQQAAS